MSGPRRVVWTEGMLMSPHHLQQQDRFHEELLSARMAALEPHSWGVLDLSIDTQGLQRGQFALGGVRAVTAEGTLLWLDSEDLPDPGDFREQFPDAVPTLDVWLALPRERAGADNYADSPATPSRFARRTRATYDQAVTSGESLEVVYGQPRPLLRFGASPPDCEAIRIAELMRGSAAEYVVSDTYVPPCLRISASPYLMAGVRQVLQQLVARRGALSDSRREAGGGAVSVHAGDVSQFLMLSAINTAIPLVQHLADAGDAHPRDVYLTLAALAGQLTSFSTELEPTQVPKFAFSDLRSTFQPLFAQIAQLLAATFHQQHVAIGLEARDDGMHSARLDDERWPACGRVLIAVEAALPRAQVGEELPRLAKVASWGDINGILDHATPGAPARVNHKPPPEVPLKARQVYFDLATDNIYWKHVTMDRNIAVYLPPEFEPSKTRVWLYGIPSAG